MRDTRAHARRRRAGSRVARVWALALMHGTLALADTVEVEITGLDEALAANARAFLSLARAADEQASLNPLSINTLHGKAADQIREALKPFGYYAPSVDGTLTQPTEEGSPWLAQYEVTPGEPVRLAEISVRLEGDGAQDEMLLAARRAPGLVKNDPLSHSAYEKAKARLEEAAEERGYRDAAFTQSVLEVDPARGEARIDLVLSTGPRYRFGELTIEQDVITDEHLRRYATFAPGDHYSTSELLEFEYRLFDSGYFGSVRLEPLEADGNMVPIRLTATPGPRRAWNLRGGYGTDTGPRAGVGFESRRLNRAGHRLRSNLEVSAPQQEVGGEYVTPLKKAATDERAWRLGLTNQDLGDTDSRRFEMGVRETRRSGVWQRIRYLRYRDEANITSNERSTAQLLVPGFTAVRMRADDITYPTRGSYVETDVHGGLGAVLSDTSFLQLRTDARLIRTIGEENRLLLRGETGTILVDDFDQLPASERFFAGGDRSVRGFGLNQLGPRDEEGQVVGGRHLLTASIEYEHRIVGKWGFGVFVDAGDAFNGGDVNVQAAVGAGLRWLSPIGMVRVDLAQPITNEGDGLRLHFTFGPEL